MCDDPAATDPHSSYGTNVCGEEGHSGISYSVNLLSHRHVRKMLREHQVYSCFHLVQLHKARKNLDKHAFHFFFFFFHPLKLI